MKNKATYNREVRTLLAKTIHLAQVYAEACDILDRVKICALLNESASENLDMAAQLSQLLHPELPQGRLGTAQQLQLQKRPIIFSGVDYDLTCKEMVDKIRKLQDELVASYESLRKNTADVRHEQLFTDHCRVYKKRKDKLDFYMGQEVFYVGPMSAMD
ncbi:hypothetical protein [Maribacter sp. 2307ULW6-5]|uniref:hypothetical protein n=1 Tax=Maribacter sp. 2307ULW6-5 TaxID=3386275 RepID=UPI0039BD3E51